MTCNKYLTISFYNFVYGDCLKSRKLLLQLLVCWYHEHLYIWYHEHLYIWYHEHLYIWIQLYDIIKSAISVSHLRKKNPKMYF